MKFKYKFNRLIFTNRWKQSGHISRGSDYTLIGICRMGFSPSEFEWRICLFGLELRLLMKRDAKIKNN